MFATFQKTALTQAWSLYGSPTRSTVQGKSWEKPVTPDAYWRLVMLTERSRCTFGWSRQSCGSQIGPSLALLSRSHSCYSCGWVQQRRHPWKWSPQTGTGTLTTHRPSSESRLPSADSDFDSSALGRWTSSPRCGPRDTYASISGRFQSSTPPSPHSCARAVSRQPCQKRRNANVECPSPQSQPTTRR